MSDNQAWLALFFDAPLLSFGGECKLDDRLTSGFPTRGAVTGLVAAALGIARSDRRQLALLAELTMLSIAFLKAPGVLIRDFQTAGGGYPKTSGGSIPVSADGKARKIAIGHRDYLADGKFAAVLGGAPPLLEKIGMALNNPVWGGWIGRKHCIPATPVFQGVFAGKTGALDRLKTLVPDSELRIWKECSLDNPEAISYSDLPVDFSTREFRRRAVTEN